MARRRREAEPRAAASAPSFSCVFCGDSVTGVTFAPPLNRSSEANDLALRLARCFTGHDDIITLEK